MEILHSNSNKRRVLVAHCGGERLELFCRDLEQDYLLVCRDTVEEALATLNEQLNDLSAIVIDEGVACAGDFMLLRAMAEERAFDTIPAIVAAESAKPERIRRCLEEGAVDVVELPCDPFVAKRRIDNAIQLRRSATFHEIGSMLRVLPSMIFLKDAEGRYVFSTQYWHHLDMGDDPKWTIRGKTDLDIRKDRENALVAMESDREILRTGKGTSYVVEVNVDGVQDFIQLIKEPVFDERGNVSGIIALGNNVTESELMKRKLARYALIDDLTGLGNRRAFNEFMEGISGRDDYPIAVISADCDNLKVINDTYGHLVGDEYIRMAALVLRATLPDEELIFRVGGDEFMAFIPHAAPGDAERYIADMERRAELFKLSRGKVVISLGSALIEGPEQDALAAIGAADDRMYAEKAAHKRAGSLGNDD